MKLLLFIALVLIATTWAYPHKKDTFETNDTMNIKDNSMENTNRIDVVCKPNGKPMDCTLCPNSICWVKCLYVNAYCHYTNDI